VAGQGQFGLGGGDEFSNQPFLKHRGHRAVAMGANHQRPGDRAEVQVARVSVTKYVSDLTYGSSYLWHSRSLSKKRRGYQRLSIPHYPPRSRSA
jgi:hypothetical protein